MKYYHFVVADVGNTSEHDVDVDEGGTI